MREFVPLAVAYYMNGVNFRISAQMLAKDMELGDDERPIRLTAIPLYFLASHAAELFLKAALLKRGFTETELRKFDYRHNLHALLAEVQRKGIPVTEDTVAVVNGLSGQHQSHQLRYTVLVDDGNKTYWPPLSCCLRHWMSFYRSRGFPPTAFRVYKAVMQSEGAQVFDAPFRMRESVERVTPRCAAAAVTEIPAK